MKPKLMTLFLILSFISGGCTPAVPAQTAEAGPALAAENTQPASVNVPNVSPTATRMPAPTSTPAPSATASPAPTATETPLPPSPTASPQVLAEFRFTGDVRQLPEANAAVIASFSQGIRLVALRQDPSGQWIYVQVAPYSYGWVLQSGVQGSGLTGLLEATPAVTATTAGQSPGGLKCFLTVAYTDAGKPKLFQVYIQGLTPVNPYTMKLFTPKNSLLFAWDFKPKADGTLYKEYNADKAAPGTYTLDILYAGETVTSCSENVVQK